MVQVILMCSGAEASLEQEMQLLEAAKEAAGSSSAVFGFIVQPAQVSRYCRRYLLQLGYPDCSSH